MQNNRKIKLFELLNKQRGKKKIIKENKLVVLFKPENIFYLTNFWGEGIVIISQQKVEMHTKLVVPRLEYTRAINISKECEVISSDRGIALSNTLINLIKDGSLVFSDSNDFDIINKIQKKIGRKNV
ncbi:MAG TPA: aminopeptidase P family N-terminal domain-containing protein, partial [Candidatus Nitrosocosmicus sp.]